MPKLDSLDTFETILAVLILGPSLACIVHVWLRRGAEWWRRLLWTCFLLAPIIGPLFYGALYHPLPPHTGATRPVKGQGGVNYPVYPPRQ